MRKSSRIVSLLAICCATAALLPAASSADGLFFSEYVEGTSNNKALELYNATGASIDLGAGGYQVWLYFNGSTTATQQMALSGSVASLSTFVFAHPSADAAILGVADQVAVNTIWYNGDDAVALVKVGPDTTFVDVIGQIGFDPGSEWGTGDTSTQDNTIRRNADVCAGDPDGSDAFDPSVQWTGYPTNTYDGLGSHTSDCHPVAVRQETWESMKQLYR
jgi:uncharacterized protein